MKEWYELSENDRKEVFIQTAGKVGLSPREDDYRKMQESMFYGKTETFSEMIMKLKKLNRKINQSGQ
jgi:hypothetical protein